MKVFLILLLTLTLSSCASLNPFDALSPKPQINANVGKNVEQEANTAKVEVGKQETNQEAEQISNDTTTNIQADKVQTFIQQLTWWQQGLLIILAGAALPSFKEMYAGVKIVVADVLQAFVVIPVKAVGDFILTLLGRNK